MGDVRLITGMAETADGVRIPYNVVFVPAYHRGLSGYIDISAIKDFYIWEMIIIKFGYRILQRYMFTQSADVKYQQIAALQKIYEMG